MSILFECLSITTLIAQAFVGSSPTRGTRRKGNRVDEGREYFGGLVIRPKQESSASAVCYLLQVGHFREKDIFMLYNTHMTSCRKVR